MQVIKPGNHRLFENDPETAASVSRMLLELERGVDPVELDVALPLAQPVTVQLVHSDGVCWEAVYSAPASKNTAGPPGQFKDRAD